MEVLNYRTFNHTPEYVTVNANGISYPDDCGYEVIGNLLTSRIYGKDLSILEVASSGRVAVTLNDIYSLDLKRNNQESNVYLSTVSENDSLILNSSNQIAFNAYKIKTKCSNLSFECPNVSFSNILDYNLNANNILFNSNSNIKLTSPGAVFQILPSNIYMNAALGVTINSGNNGYIQALSNLFLDANQKAFLTLAAQNGEASMRGNIVKLLTNTNDGLSEALVITRDVENDTNDVYINGNLQITGTFETVNVVNTNLTVNDKIIEIAYSGNEGPNEDGPLNTGAGIKIDGWVSSNVNFNSDVDKLEYYKKSILWKYNKGGIDLLGTAEGVSVEDNDLAESYWDFRGGGIQFNVCKQDNNKNLLYLGYGFRINEYDQFELYKRIPSSNGYTIKRISRWGGCGTTIL
jgi:hypothetical protein